jgi:3-oxoacyl-[acyl-carrier-protein] synthase III
MTTRAVVRGVGTTCPTGSCRMPNSRRRSTPRTTGSLALGIERRHFAAEGQTTSDLATRAARAALADAGLTADDIDALIVATSTADLTFPSAATMVQAASA